ncbi:MAG: hypothetical protein AAGF11_17710 [Myxococcota bacterium]
MSAWVLATVLLAAPAEDVWEPAKAPPPTPWAMAGARGWRLCQEAERRAVAYRNGDGPRGGNGSDDQRWQRYARQCPHAVEVLVAAGLTEILVAADLFREIGSGDEPESAAGRLAVQRIVEQHRERLETALGWLDASIAESGRRGQRPPRQARYYRAYALTALGRIAQAREALAEVIEAGDVERWRSERMAALIELFAGDLDQALRRAHRGVYDAPAEDRIISRFIRALVLDRAGASVVARAELRAIQRQSGADVLRGAMESVLPLHERLFFRALYSQALELRSPALRFWQFYLERPEPEQPERVLAQRHLDELTPPPVPAGGP